MILAKTPWLHNDNNNGLETYVFSIFFACVDIVDQYFEIPEGSEIRFVVHNRPSKDRYPAYVQRDGTLVFNEDQYEILYNSLEYFLKRFDVEKTYYVECEIR